MRFAQILRRLGTGLACFVLLALAGLVVWGLWPLIYADLEHYQIKLERARRLARSSLGLPLAGTPDLSALSTRLDASGLKLGAPIFMRIFKREFELELWMLRDGRFHRFATYPICRWSGRLGPKLRQGDHQAPEGFYTVDAKALNPASRWHRSFNLGFPNAFDRSYARTGTFLMVHGGCSSIGCYAMTNAVIDEIWRIVTAALDAGQKRFQVQVFPFRMTDAGMQRHAESKHAAFWRELKQGHDRFEADLLPPRISVCERHYRFEQPGAVSDGSTPIDIDCSSDKPSSS